MSLKLVTLLGCLKYGMKTAHHWVGSELIKKTARDHE